MAQDKIIPLEKICIEPNKPAKHCVIWLHGLGADGHDFEPIAETLALPEDKAVRFIFPHAPIRPVTLNAHMHMRAWFDIYSLTNIEREDVDGILTAHSQIQNLIKTQIDDGIPAKNIVLAGFSQGGVMALYTGLHFPEELGGIIALSTFVPLAKSFAQQHKRIHKNIAIFQAHGDSDPILPVKLGEITRDLLMNVGYEVEWHVYPMAHEVCGQEVQDIRHWLIARLNNSSH